MPTSISARRTKSAGKQNGFTLLEILVVVALMALLSTLMITASLRNARDSVAPKMANSLQTTLQLMSERSLFTGEMLALYVENTRAVPMMLNTNTLNFEPLSEPFRELMFDDPLALSWEQNRGTDEELLLKQVGESFAKQSATEKPPVPQIFFFPSGETSATRFFVRDTESGQEIEILLSSLGRTTRPQQDDSP